MITSQFLKKTLLYFSFMVFSMLAVIACKGDEQVDSKEVAEDLNKPKNDLAKEQDERFMVRVAEIDFEQILLGKLAYQRATSPEVKDFGKTVEEAHRTSKSELGSMAIMKSIAIPTTPTKSVHQVYDKINEASVEDFDATYLSSVIASHNEAIRLFEECIKGNNDQEIRTWAIGKLPDLRMHLTKAMELDAQYGPLSEVVR